MPGRPVRKTPTAAADVDSATQRIVVTAMHRTNFAPENVIIVILPLPDLTIFAPTTTRIAVHLLPNVSMANVSSVSGRHIVQQGKNVAVEVV